MKYYFSPVGEDGRIMSDQIIERDMPMSEATDEIEIDGVMWRRNYGAEGKGTRCTAWSTPLRSNACGVGLHQIDKFEKRNAKAGNNVRYDRTTGQAIFESRRQRAQFLKDTGQIDFDGGYKDG